MKLTLNNIIDKIKFSKSVSSIIRSINNREDLKNFILFKTQFLPTDSNFKRRLFHIKNDLYYIKKCEMCGINNKEWNDKYSIYKDFCITKECKNKHTVLNTDNKKKIEKIKNTKIFKYGSNYGIKLCEKSKKTCLEKYGVDHYTKTEEYKHNMIENFGYVSPFELKETHEKSRQTLLERYGVNHNFKISGMSEKIEETFIKKYGFNKPLKNDAIKQKLINTNLERYGFASPLQNEEIYRKSLDTLMKNYGVNAPLKSEIVLERFRNTNLRKYGETHWMKNTDFYENFLNSKQKSTYKKCTIEDEIYFLQGYEDYVLEELLKLYKMNDILIKTNDINKFTGTIKYNFNNEEHRYYPDFFIISENLIIEVKSTYTYFYELDKNIEKEKSCLNMGFNFQFIIIEKSEYNKWKRKNNKKI